LRLIEVSKRLIISIAFSSLFLGIRFATSDCTSYQRAVY